MNRKVCEFFLKSTRCCTPVAHESKSSARVWHLTLIRSFRQRGIIVDFTINWTLSLGTDKVFYSL